MSTFTPTPRKLNHRTAAQFLETRRAELLEAAGVIADLAASVLADGDTDAAGELVALGRSYMDDVARIDACRVSA